MRNFRTSLFVAIFFALGGSTYAGYVYGINTGGAVVKYDTSTLAPAGAVNTSYSALGFNDIAASGDTLYCTYSGGIYALNFDGSLKSSSTTYSDMISTAVAQDGTVYALQSSGKIYKYDSDLSNPALVTSNYAGGGFTDMAAGKDGLYFSYNLGIFKTNFSGAYIASSGNYGALTTVAYNHSDDWVYALNSGGAIVKFDAGISNKAVVSTSYGGLGDMAADENGLFYGHSTFIFKTSLTGTGAVAQYNYGGIVSTAVSMIPEPATMMLLCVSGMAVFFKHKERK